MTKSKSGRRQKQGDAAWHEEDACPAKDEERVRIDPRCSQGVASWPRKLPPHDDESRDSHRDVDTNSDENSTDPNGLGNGTTSATDNCGDDRVYDGHRQQ